MPWIKSSGVYRGWSYIRVWLFIHYCINSNLQTSITGSVQQQSSSIFEYLSCSTLFKKDSRCEQCLSNRWFNHHLVKVGPMLMFASSFVQDLNRRRNRFVRTASNRGICGGVFCHSRRLHRKTFIWSWDHCRLQSNFLEDIVAGWDSHTISECVWFGSCSHRGVDYNLSFLRSFTGQG